MSRVAVEAVPPPAGWRAAYRFLGLRLPEQYRAWVADDLSTDAQVRRTVLARAVPFLPLYAALVGIALAYDGSTLGRWGFFGGLFGAILGQVLGALFQTRRIRVRILRWQRVDQRGEPVEPTGFCRLSNAAAVGLNIAALAVVMPLVGWLILSVAGG